ncbi:hypothetical protein BKA69DRAFT_1099766 [Paraphysoderma sedebokerense]|nr:hypothetical protein BKA69DRAFT_1099766 [Paraphysoderma sedebokerense]
MKSFSQQIFKSDKLPQFQYFVFIQFIQKLLLDVVDMFFTRYVVVQTVLMSYILITMVQVYFKHRPYTYNTLNALEMLSLSMSFLVVSLGQVFRSEALKNDTQRFGITLLVLFLIFGFLLVALMCGLYEFHRKVRGWVSGFKKTRIGGSQKKVQTMEFM